MRKPKRNSCDAPGWSTLATPHSDWDFRTSRNNLHACYDKTRLLITNWIKTLRCSTEIALWLLGLLKVVFPRSRKRVRFIYSISRDSWEFRKPQWFIAWIYHAIGRWRKFSIAGKLKRCDVSRVMWADSSLLHNFHYHISIPSSGGKNSAQSLHLTYSLFLSLFRLVFKQ